MSGCRAYITYNQRVVLYANKSSPIWLFCILFFLFAFFLWQLGVCQCTANFSLQIFYLGNLEGVLLSPLSFQEPGARHSTSIQFTWLWGWFLFRFSKRRASNSRGQFCSTTCSIATPSCKGFTTADYLESLLPLQSCFSGHTSVIDELKGFKSLVLCGMKLHGFCQLRWSLDENGRNSNVNRKWKKKQKTKKHLWNRYPNSARGTQQS